MKTKLSKHFTLDEFTRSDTAKRLGIDNAPTNDIVENLTILCENILEPSRIIFGKKIIITSGYRCQELNKAVGGKTNSYHLKGKAADIRICNDKEACNLAKILVSQKMSDLVLFEHSGNTKWLHVQWSENPRNRLILNYRV